MGYYWLFYIPFFLVLALPAIFLIRIVVRGLTLPRGLRRGRAAVCGRCSQEVADITESAPLPLRCPECGTKYAQAGLLTLGLAKRTRPGMVGTIVSWTVLCLMIGGFAVSIASSVAAWGGGTFTAHQRFSHTIQAIRTDGAAPTAEPGYEVRFDGDIEYPFGSAISSGTLTLTIRPDTGPAATVEIDAATLAWTIPSTGASGSAFDRGAALDAFEAAGIDTSPAHVDFEAGELADAVAFVNTSPDSAVHSVLGTWNQPYTQVGVAQTVQSTWSPRSLTVTDQGNDADGDLFFRFESDTIDANYNGAPSDEAYDGEITFDLEPDLSGTSSNAKTVARVSITIRPPEGWPVSIDYDPTAGTGTLSRAETSTEVEIASDQEAIERIAEEAGLADGAGSRDPGLADLLDLAEGVRQNPARHTSPSAAGVGSPQSSPANARANSPGDGLPDGGFAESRPATQNWMTNTTGNYSASFPVAILVTTGVCFILYAGGVALIVVRRHRIYPERLVGPQGPPNPSAVGPHLPGRPAAAGTPPLASANPTQTPTQTPHQSPPDSAS